jgi:hypothetical protein
MYKRKQYVVDKSFQLKTTFTIIGFIFICVALLTILMSVNVYDNNKKLDKILMIEDNIVQVLTSSDVATAEQAGFNRKMARDHSENQQNMMKMINYNYILIYVIIGIIFIQGVVLFFVLIRQTHRIAGPLFVVTRYMKDIINGHYPEHLRPLRDTDLLKDFYAIFNEMVFVLRERSRPKTAKAITKKAAKKAVKAPKKAAKKAVKKTVKRK